MACYEELSIQMKKVTFLLIYVMYIRGLLEDEHLVIILG